MKKTTTTNIKLTLLIILLVTLTLGGTYAYLNMGTSANNKATGTGGCFQVTYSGQIISDLSNKTVQSTPSGTETDIYSGSVANANSRVTLSKGNSCKIYTEADIYIHTTSTTAPISTVPALKYKITNSSTSTIIGQGVISSTGDKKIATVTLTDTATNYDIYMWIDSNISGGAFNDTTYNGYIYAESKQTSAIKN